MKTVGLIARLIGNQTLLLASVSADTEAEAIEGAQAIQSDPEMVSELWRPRT